MSLNIDYHKGVLGTISVHGHDDVTAHVQSKAVCLSFRDAEDKTTVNCYVSLAAAENLLRQLRGKLPDAQITGDIPPGGGA